MKMVIKTSSMFGEGSGGWAINHWTMSHAWDWHNLVSTSWGRSVNFSELGKRQDYSNLSWTNSYGRFSK